MSALENICGPAPTLAALTEHAATCAQQFVEQHLCKDLHSIHLSSAKQNTPAMAAAIVSAFAADKLLCMRHWQPSQAVNSMQQVLSALRLQTHQSCPDFSTALLTTKALNANPAGLAEAARPEAVSAFDQVQDHLPVLNEGFCIPAHT